jgi:hypothetical protein
MRDYQYKDGDIDKAFADFSEELDKLTDEEFMRFCEAVAKDPEIRFANKKEFQEFVEKTRGEGL